MPSKIAILTGGESAERAVALMSSEFVVAQANRFFETKVFDFPKDIDSFIAERSQFRAAIPVFHGRGGEDGQIQGFLETLKIPYIFSGIDGQSVGMNKLFTKQIASSLEIRQPDCRVVLKGEQVKFTTNSVVKPYDNGSSVGVFIVNSQAELDRAIKEVLKVSQKVFVEVFISGEEYTVAIVEEKSESIALPVIQIKPRKNTFFDYESKYSDGGAEEICPAPIDEGLNRELQQTALKVHRALGLRHMSRSDFIVSGSDSYFLEVNTIPGLTKNSLVPKAVKAAGRDFGLLLKDWVESVLSPDSV